MHLKWFSSFRRLLLIFDEKKFPDIKYRLFERIERNPGELIIELKIH
jgi:hypothetical protein